MLCGFLRSHIEARRILDLTAAKFQVTYFIREGRSNWKKREDEHRPASSDKLVVPKDLEIQGVVTISSLDSQYSPILSVGRLRHKH